MTVTANYAIVKISEATCGKTPGYPRNRKSEVARSGERKDQLSGSNKSTFLPQLRTRWIFKLLIAFRMLGSSKSPSSLNFPSGMSTTDGALKCSSLGLTGCCTCAGMNSCDRKSKSTPFDWRGWKQEGILPIHCNINYNCNLPQLAIKCRVRNL